VWCRCRSASSASVALIVALGASALADAVSQAEGGAAPRIAVAPFRSFELRLDGELSEWEEVPGISLDSSSYLLSDTALYDGNPDLSGAIQFVWDTMYLYVAGRFADDRLTAGAAWTSDRVNLVFDFLADNHPLSYDGKAPDASRWQPDDQWVYAHVVGDGEPPYPVMRLASDYHGPVGGAQLVSRSVEAGWTFEMRVPWAELAEARPFVGAVFGMQVFVTDGDGVGRLTEIMWSERWGYSREAGLMWELWKMGRLVLTGEPLTLGAPGGSG
jgi:hypothetical protein